MTTICERILAVDKRIGFAMLVDDKGEIVESKMRGTLLMPKEEIAAFAGIWTGVMGGVAKQMQKYLGNHFGLSIYYDKVNIHGLAVGDRSLVITARKDLPFEIVLSLKKIAEA
jgi:hypothetical protein